MAARKLKVHGYTASGDIEATIHGQRWSIPDDPQNGLRQMITRDWEDRGRIIPEYVQPQPSADDIRTECRRRILLVMTEDEQRNSLAAMLLDGDESSRVHWVEIERLRARSNEIEADPPADYTDDKYWTPTT